MPKIITCLIFSFTFTITNAQPYFDFNDKARAAYEKAISLRFEEARREIAQLKIAEPENYIVYHIENYIDFFTIFINEDKKEFDRLEDNKDFRIDKLKDADPESPYYYYTQAEIKLQWALARLKFEEYFTAFMEIRSAYKLLSKNLEKHPGFVANNKSLGILHALVGTIPDNYKWGVKLLSGMNGTIEQGRQEIEEVLDHARYNDFIFEAETQVMYAFLLLHLNNKSEAAWSVIRSGVLDPDNNPLACFVLANVALRTGRNDEAIRILQQRPHAARFHPFYYLDFLLGLAKLYRQDKDATIYLNAYLRNFNGVNYIKEAYQKLAWDALLKEDQSGYFAFINKCKTKGSAVVGGDKNALKEAESGNTPHPHLLKARLLFDGGYHQKAYQFLKQKQTSAFTHARHKLEYTYRLGRICHALQKPKEAFQYYQQTIDEGKEESYYYACNAALQMGILHETQDNIVRAKDCFRLCLKIKPEEYRNSLHQKAKAGLNRLESK